MSYQDYPNYPPPGYAQQTSSLAIVSLVAGILSYFLLPILGAITAIITGNIAKKEIRKSNGRLTGKGMATWGVILGWINIGFYLLVMCVLIIIIFGVFGSFAAFMTSISY